MRISKLFLPALYLVLTFTTATARAELKPNQARKLITKVAGAQLPSSVVRVKRVAMVDANNAEVTAEIETAWRFEQDTEGRWRVREVRIAADRWEDLPFVMGRGDESAPQSSSCDTPSAHSDAAPTVKRVRCLLAEFLGIQLPSDAVRIKEVSSFDVPLASRPSALVVATVQPDFRFTAQGKSGWTIAALRTGNRDWISIDSLMSAIDQRKRASALAELQTIAAALEKFRAERGFYVASDEQRVLIDHLSPRYLRRVIRVDPWHRLYQYQGERDRFSLRSDGPDGKQNTADDVVISSR